MKNTITIFSIFIVCNISFSQEKKPDLPLENQLKEKSEDPVFRFYPNPVEDELFVIGTAKIKSIEIMDASGKRVVIYEFDKSIIRLNVSDIKAGNYLLKVIDINNKQDIKTLVVK